VCAAIEYVMTPRATISPGLRTCWTTAAVVLTVATASAMNGWLRRVSTATNATTAISTSHPVSWSVALVSAAFSTVPASTRARTESSSIGRFATAFHCSSRWACVVSITGDPTRAGHLGRPLTVVPAGPRRTPSAVAGGLRPDDALRP
jgi:hypothetical protein